MKKTIVPTLAGLFIAANMLTVANAADDAAKAKYKAAKESASAAYKEARAKCDSLSGNPKDICVAEAKADEKRAKANAEAEYENTPKAHMKARIAAAEADYSVAKEKCDMQVGNAKDVCVKEAKAAHVKAKADAESHKKIAEAKSDAYHEKSDANYKVEMEKCDALSGSAEDACEANVKAKYGK